MEMADTGLAVDDRDAVRVEGDVAGDVPVDVAGDVPVDVAVDAPAMIPVVAPIAETRLKRTLFLLIAIAFTVGYAFFLLSFLAPAPGRYGVDENAYLVGW